MIEAAQRQQAQAEATERQETRSAIAESSDTRGLGTFGDLLAVSRGKKKP